MIQDAPAQLPEVVVTAARLPPAAGEAAFSTTRLGSERLEDQRRLDEALAEVPAVSLFRRNSSLAANPTTQGLSLRAIAPTGAGRALVTLDGVPLNDPFGGWVIWSQLPPEAVGSLDVIRGAGSGPYGAGALTGVVQLRERDEGQVVDGSVAGRGGARLAASGGGGLGPLSLRLSGVHERSDGYLPVRGGFAGAADQPLDLDLWSVAARADARLGAGAAALSIRASAFEEDRGSGLAGARATASGEAVSATLARPPLPGGYGWRLQAWRRWSDLANSSVAVAADRSTTTPANDQMETPAVGWGLNAALRRRSGPLEWEVGADARFAEGETRELFRFMAETFTRSRTAGGETAVMGAYGDASWSAGPWLVAGGLRVDRSEQSGGGRLERDLASGAATLDERYAASGDTVWTGRLAARRTLGGAWSGRAAAYAGFRPATLNELHRPFRVGNDLTEANPFLKPERLSGLEAGLAWRTVPVRGTATLFWNRLEDAVVNVTVGQGPATFPRAGFVPAGGVLRQRQNAGTIEAVGLELAADGDLGERLSWRGALSATDARVDGGAAAPQLTGLRPAQAPIWSVTAGLEWRATDRLSLSADGRWESRRFDDDLNSRVLEAALILDARAEWRVTDRASAYVAAGNLLDAEVETAETAGGVPSYGAPRTLSAGLRFRY